MTKEEFDNIKIGDHIGFYKTKDIWVGIVESKSVDNYILKRIYSTFIISDKKYILLYTNRLIDNNWKVISNEMADYYYKISALS